MKHCQFEALQSYPSDDTLQKLVLLRMNKKYMEYRRTREPLLARRLLLDKVRAGQEKAALEKKLLLLAMLAPVAPVARRLTPLSCNGYI